MAEAEELQDSPEKPQEAAEGAENAANDELDAIQEEFEANAGDAPSAEQNRKNLKAVGQIHGAAVIGALTLFGAAHTWAASSGWALAIGVSIAAAFVAGTVLSAIVHEWSHFTGASLSGSQLTVAKKPVRMFFMFNFDMKANSVNQALWLSWGGVLGSWAIAAAMFALVPMDSWASAVLVATLVGNAVNASYFEVPVIFKTRRSQDFEGELMSRLESPGVVQVPGLVVGLLTLALLT